VQPARVGWQVGPLLAAPVSAIILTLILTRHDANQEHGKGSRLIDRQLFEAVFHPVLGVALLGFLGPKIFLDEGTLPPICPRWHPMTNPRSGG
jgi:hypothetical protein